MLSCSAFSARGEKEPFRADKAARAHFETTTQRKHYTILFQNLQEDSDRFFRICHLHNFRAVRCAFCTMRKTKKPVSDGLFGFIRSIYIRQKQSFYAPKIVFASFSSEATMASAPSRVGAQALRYALIFGSVPDGRIMRLQSFSSVIAKTSAAGRSIGVTFPHAISRRVL